MWKIRVEDMTLSIIQPIKQIVIKSFFFGNCIACGFPITNFEKNWVKNYTNYRMKST